MNIINLYLNPTKLFINDDKLLNNNNDKPLFNTIYFYDNNNDDLIYHIIYNEYVEKNNNNLNLLCSILCYNQNFIFGDALLLCYSKSKNMYQNFDINNLAKLLSNYYIIHVINYDPIYKIQKIIKKFNYSNFYLNLTFKIKYNYFYYKDIDNTINILKIKNKNIDINDNNNNNLNVLNNNDFSLYPNLFGLFDDNKIILNSDLIEELIEKL